MADPNHPFFRCVRGEMPWPPAVQLLGRMVLEAEVGGGRIRVQFEAKPEYANRIGCVHGGFLAAMLDEALTGAAATTLETGEFAATIALNVNYLRPAKLGVILGEGHVVHRGKSIAFLSGELRSPDGDLIATATATVRLVHPPQQVAL